VSGEGVCVDPESLDRRALLKIALLAGAALAVDGCTEHPRRAPSAGATPPTSSPPATPSAQRTAAAAAPGAPTTPLTPSVTSTPTAADAGSPTPVRGPAIEIVRGPASAPSVALTFHGAGDPALATRLLTAVEASGSHVSVLAVGQWLEAEPQMAARILDGGHDLGNHTYRHLTMPSLTAALDDSEITRCAEVLQKLTGSPSRWFRPSGTDHATPRILAAAGRAGYATSISYDVDPLDYDDPGAATIASRVLTRVRPGSIVSLHFGHLETVEAMPAVLDGLRARGLAVVTLTSLLGNGGPP